MRALAGRANGSWRQNRWIANGILADGVLVPVDGLWQPVEGLWPLTIVVGGEFTSFTAQIRVCNLRRRPADDDNTWPSIYEVQEARIVTFEQPFFWVKFQVTAIVVAGDNIGVHANYAAGGQGG